MARASGRRRAVRAESRMLSLRVAVGSGAQGDRGTPERASLRGESCVYSCTVEERMVHEIQRRAQGMNFKHLDARTQDVLCMVKTTQQNRNKTILKIR